MNNWIFFGVITALVLFTYWFISSKKTLSKDKEIIKRAIAAHGDEVYNQSHFSYDFRDKSYSFKHDNGFFEYTRTTQQGDSTIVDITSNEGFKRLINDVEQNLSEEDAVKYSGSVVSVNYFALLPYKLEDEAIISEHREEISIGGKDYHVIKIAFKEENGGEDHDDIYYYWINKESNFVDYLAYSYPINGGGVRFRSAYNGRRVGGIYFQDYVNYKAPYETPLEQLPQMFENGELEKLSIIELKNIERLD